MSAPATTRLVQLVHADGSRRVALVEEPDLLCLDGVASVYELAELCLEGGYGMAAHARSLPVAGNARL